MTSKIRTPRYKKIGLLLLLQGVVYLLLITATLTAQTASSDSLLKAVRAMPDGTNKINILLRISKIYLKSDSTLSQLKDIAGCYSSIGGTYANIGDYKKALDYHIKALKIAETISDKNKICESYISMGTVFFEQNKFKETIEYMNKALAIEGKQTTKRN